MQQVSPATSLRIVYLIQDHTDPNTYYVRSVVRNSVTGAILATVNLTDTGDRRFYGTFQTPNAEDMFIDITTTVYSDSGYTTKAQDKYEELQQYLVKTQWGLQFGGASGGSRGPGEKIDYKLIKKLLKEVLDEEEKIEPKEVEKYDDSQIVSMLDLINSKLGDLLKVNFNELKPKEVNFGPVIKKLENIIEILNREAHRSFDYTPILNNILDTKEYVSSKIDSMVAKSNGQIEFEEPLERTMGGYKTKIPILSSRVKRLMNNG